MDRFLEEIVVKKSKALNEILYVLSAVVMVVSALLGMMYLNAIFYGFSVGILVVTVLNLGIAAALFLFRDRLRTEYEYTFTNGDMDFAQVYNNKKRKNLGSLKMNRIEAFGKVNSASFQRYITMRDIRKTNWFLNRGSELYYFYFQKENNKRIIIIEPSEDMVQYIKLYLPRGAWQE